MPTEYERSVTSPTTIQANATEIKDNLTKPTGFNEDLITPTIMEGDMSTSQTSTTSNGSSSCNGGRKTSITSPDPTAYVAKARVTRPTPPPPPYNPMQFVQIKPCNLYQTAQEQLKKAEEVKKIKEIRKEEPEDWQNNLDNWKSSRRKRVEHIIDRVVEVKKLELEEHDRTRRKSKTFSEMIEERGERSGGRGLNKLVSLAVYAEDEANDLSDLGIGTSSASGKSSLSEDYDNNSVMSDNAAELDKAITNSTQNKSATTESTTREYISSPGYETSSSTAPASSPDPCEYTYEGAIQDYKQRVSRAASGLTSVALNKFTLSQQQNSKDSTPERSFNKETAYPPRRGSKIEDRLIGFEVQSPSEECVEKNKVDVPKIDISKRKEIFESHETQNCEPKCQLAGGVSNNTGVPRVTLKHRFKAQDTADTLTEQPKKELKRLSGDITSIKERLQSLEQQQNLVNGANGATKTTANKLVDIPVPPLKERLSSLQNAVTKEEARKPPVALVDARQLEIMKSEDAKAQQTLKEVKQEVALSTKTLKDETLKVADETSPEEIEEVDRDDSGIHTADDVELEERTQADIMKKEQELKLNAAIEALAQEEKQLSEAASAVNQIEAEFEELTLGSVALPPLSNNTNASATPITNEHMEYSVSSTNPQVSKTRSNNNSSQISHNNNNHNSSISQSSNGNGNGTYGSGINSNGHMVKGLDFKAASNLRRKPTNEMVHAKNLLKIFKETFQNDIDLDEQEIIEDNETKTNTEDGTPKPETGLGLNIKTHVVDNSKTEALAKGEECSKTLKNVSNSPNIATTCNHAPLSSSMIPRPVTPLGKPPMSPITIRSSTKFLAATPPGSPSLGRKNDSQFSINGRVEIFNSKTMCSSPNNSYSIKPTTPTVTTKKTQLPHFNGPKNMQTNSIVLPNQQKQQQLSEDATTKEQQETTTVTEPLSTISVATAARKIQQQNDDDNGKIKHLKSMPSQQMVNEPQTKLAGATDQQHQPNPNNELAKQQQQQPEVVVCAPPITIVNPDELPKPNTVKNLSSCFQQQQQQQHQQQQNRNGNAKQLAPKPLPRTRIPQVTPPPSPALPRRHLNNTTPKASTEQTNKLSPSPMTLEEEKKLSMISLDSTSSTSTGCTVIDNSKKLSIVSNTSSTSEDVPATLVNTRAQVHTEPYGKELEMFKTQDSKIPKEDDWKPAKTLDKEATQVLVQEMIRAENQNRTLILNTKDLRPKTLEPLKINLDTNTTENDVANSTPLSSSANSPFKSPLQPLQSPTAKTITPTSPLVVCKCKNISSISPKPRTAPSPVTPTAEISPSVIVPAELPALPDCPPNESTLYKLASSAPHSPSSPGLNLEQKLAIDSAICNSLLTSLAVTPEVLQRQHTVEEDVCQKVDKESLPFHHGSTGFKDISKTDIKHCEGISLSNINKLQTKQTQRQTTVEEELCQKLDINTLPDDKQVPLTSYKCVSPTEIRKCDNFFATGSGKPSSKPNSKPNSPIIEARAAHSKALIETCEKIIAEERLTSNQLKSSLPSSPVGTPIMPRKSKIPKPIASCCKATESLSEADQKASNHSLTKDDKNGAIARLHVVETQIKVTTTTPPASPKPVVKASSSTSPANKKTKNIFDFLKKNFGVGNHSSHKEEHEETMKVEATLDTDQENKVLVLTEPELEALEKVKYDEVHTIDNSKFYIPSHQMNSDDGDDKMLPPPLPKTPAPVNIEITRKIITNEILEGDKSEKDLTQEIDDLLDDELNKLNYEIQELEKAGRE